MPSAAETRTAYRTCPLCEASCGLELTLAGDDVVKVRGDKDDVFSQGFICPKGAAIGELHADPDRVRTPLVRRDGELVPASWDEAFAVIAERLAPILEDGDRDALAVYLGNPNAHNLANLLYMPAFLKALGHQERLLGEHRRPVPQADGLGADVRHRLVGGGPRPRPHRPPRRHGREPAGLERLAC